MTQAEDLVDSIREGPHWHVRILPEDLTPRIATPLACRDVAERAAVRLRGRPFPEVETDARDGGSNPILSGFESWTQFGEKSAWRLMQSGQFVYFSTLLEDNEPESWVNIVGSSAKDGPFIDLSNVIYTVTEFTEFLFRIVKQCDYGSSVTFEVGLRGITGRRLLAEVRRPMFRGYAAAVDDLPTERRIELPGLDGDGAGALALDLAEEMLQLFGFATDRRALGDIQDYLYSRSR